MLLALLALILAMGGVMLLQKSFVPKFGLDLAGGTTVTLSPVTQSGATPSQESLDLAVNIIRERVNGSGISDAEVAKAGDNIVISVPGAGQEEVVKLVGTTAELRFRQVLAVAPANATPGALPTAPATPAPSGSGAPQPSTTAKPSSTAKPAPSGTPAGRALSSALTNPTPAPSASATGQGDKKDDKKGSGKDEGKATPTPSGSAAPSAPPTEDPFAGVDLTGVDPVVAEQFKKLDCTKKDRGQGIQDEPDKQLAACSDDGVAKYVLDKAAVKGTEVAGANSGVDSTTGEWIVQVNFKSAGASQFAKITGQITSAPQPRNQLAMVLDGVVISAPVIEEPIPGGQARISGSFTQKTADDLANQLKYGALPLKFVQSSIEEVSSTLGADQLRGGLLAGGIGLILVVLYSLLYYRGLGLVAVASLAVATILTYQAVVLLGHNANFRLSLPHIIGLIVSIGITADSFIVYFERMRDEMKEGRRSLRVAVEVAWVRARRTILIADAVMFIAAVVLYFLAVGGVAGFAFAMGLTTLIDIAVVFLFTKPFVALLARLSFFAKGHKLSGLDAERMGRDAPVARTTVSQEG
ncbi:protein translocase subunit SecD [Sphaerisporangium krabiense]|uniref:Protein translocase subunit SecD n=1 Tax=Sphaerisporangium krabiense TaxID=763782 RepID=A0A7W8ZBD9_9ACTN|nr:protein translocase subunit SecD [Sphaerisporangium krabiense]MBB5630872.1 preprotein translocase subunit SecD [Sphaerisporangium krabiense]GII65444.1 protein translocase subunit SecD [Sphaerisporangium krabiense]